jgi:hypothetical protein
MPDLDLSWPSPELAQAAADVVSDLDLRTCSCGRVHDQDGTCPPPQDGESR